MNFQLKLVFESNGNWSGQPMPESHEFSIRIQLESKGNWSGAAHARILLDLN